MAPRNGVSLVAALCLMALFVQVFVQQASAEYYPASSPAPSPEGYPVPAPETPPPGEWSRISNLYSIYKYL